VLGVETEFSHRELVARATASLAAQPGRRLEPDDLRRAAVAVLMVDRGGVCRVPLIVRGHDAPVHGGQIALPGGRVEPSDVDLGATARREAMEELGVPFEAPQVLGTLDDVPTPTGFLITPVVCALRGDVPIVPNPAEVAAWFEAPLDVFADPARAEIIGDREWRGRKYTLKAYMHEERRIWGATARIMEDLAVRVLGVAAAT
jgi:8-oxo-dGTP pyrophosphatase MutT (NUDIX family)